MSLRALHDQLDWPTEEKLIAPAGVGPRILTDLAQRKIARAIQRELGTGPTVRVGLLTKNAEASGTEAPIAVVCEFTNSVSERILSLAHRLAWNFAKSPLLITVEPHVVRAWSCCELPSGETASLFDSTEDIDEARLDLTASLSPSERAAHALHWVRLATGDFYQRFPDRFRRDGRADRVLLDELTMVRRRLQRQDLGDDSIHDLLARIVFAQFLFDRKDADGTSALNPSLLQKLQEGGHLHATHTDLSGILADYGEAYRFFRWLNDKFNGDLFPGKGETSEQREAEWQSEMQLVEPRHLETLSEFVSGRMRGRQRMFWRLYRFDVIPLEFISSIYEEFVTSTGGHYTPGFLVDFMLDEVLPWGSDEWKVRVLDPACGSGIFLVKAYQRLIQRWKNAHPDQTPAPSVLRRLLENQLFGVDIDEHAVRVASFSLYLTMCDAIDPKNYLKNTRFPRLRNKRLVHADFFREDQAGFCTTSDAGKYNLVIGNAPWGRNTMTDSARDWAKDSAHPWEVANKAVGTLFLAKAAALTKADGRVSMIQPASSLLFNRNGPANRFREKLFTEFHVEEVVNLSTLRFELFENATSPPCIVTLRPFAPNGEPLLYISPKQVKPAGGADVAESSYSIVIEPHDISQVLPDEAAFEPHVWTALAWGGRRDFVLMQRLSSGDTLEKYRTAKLVSSREGMIRGDRKQKQSHILDRPLLEDDNFPGGTFLFLDVDRLPPNKDPQTHSRDSTSLEAFELPQLLIKQGWTVESGRFQASVVRSRDGRGVICSQSYISTHAATEHANVLEACGVIYNSIFAVYFLLLSSGRLASYRPEPLVVEMRNVPLTTFPASVAANLTTYQQIDDLARKHLGVQDADWALIEDLFNFTLPDFKGDETSPGRQSTTRKPRLKTANGREPHLSAYCRSFLDVLLAGFGEDKHVCATIYQDSLQDRLPVRLVAIHLGWDRKEPIAVESIESPVLCQQLSELDEKFLQIGDTSRGGIFFQRVARVYVEEQCDGETVPTIYIVKPDRIRYWTRSAGMRDADEVAADMWTWTPPPVNETRKPK